MGRRNEYQPKGGDALRLGSKDRYGSCKTVSSHRYTRAISERFRDKGLIIKRYINSSVLLLLSLISFHSLFAVKVQGQGSNVKVTAWHNLSPAKNIVTFH